MKWIIFISMLSVSSGFHAAAIATTRKPVAKLEVTWSDRNIDHTITYTSNTDNLAHIDSQTTDGQSVVAHKWAHFKTGGIPLDGTAYLAPASADDGYQMGWWSAAASDANGDLAQISGAYPYLNIAFAARPIYAFKVAGDSAYNEYPVDFVITARNGATLLHTETVVGNTNLIWEKTLSAYLPTVTSIRLSISKWSAANAVLKITEFYTPVVETIYPDDIISVRVLEEKEINNGSLPIGNISANEADIEIQNIRVNRTGVDIEDPFHFANTLSPFASVMRANRKIRIYMGFEVNGAPEYALMGTYWSSDWNVSQNGSTVTTTARDRMEQLRRAQFSNSQVYEDITLYDLVLLVLNDAETSLSLADFEWDVEATLANYTVPYAYLPEKSYFETLRSIASAGMGQVYIDRSGVLRVTGNYEYNNESTDLVIDENNYFNLQQPSNVDNTANKITVITQPLTAATTPEDIYVGTETTTSVSSFTVDVKFNKKPCVNCTASMIHVNGEPYYTITSQSFTSFGGTISISGSAGKYKIKVVGYPLTVQGSETITRSDSTSIAENGLQSYNYPDNALVQDSILGAEIAETLLASYKNNRKDIELSWRGNPALELSDIVQCPEYNKNEIYSAKKYVVVRNQIDYDGTLKQSSRLRKVN